MPACVINEKAQNSALANMLTINNCELLHIKTKYGTALGGMQSWYPIEWQRRSGCGPTTASLIFWYLAQTRKEYKSLCRFDASEKEGFSNLMCDVWQHVKPGFRGLNKISMMTEGVKSYALMCGVNMQCNVLEVPAAQSSRPQTSEMTAFLLDAISNNLPVAFLNLSNGKLKNLDGWHWVTIVGINPENGTALMYDQGRQVIIDIDLWLQTTLVGGGFVVFR